MFLLDDKKLMYCVSQIIPFHNYLEDKQILDENIPFTMEK
jgi:hypothetical protein